MRKRTLSLFLTAAMTATALAGCGGGNTGAPEATTQAQTTAAGGSGETQASNGSGGGEAAQVPGEFSYPMAPGDKLTYWCELTTTVSANYASLGDTPFGKGWQAETGTEIEFLHPPAGQLKEQFSLILADGNLPDLMEYNWMRIIREGRRKLLRTG